MLISLVLGVVLAILASYFASNNLEVVQISLFGLPVRQAVGILLVTALGVGVILGVLVTLPMVISSNWALIRHKRKMQDWQDAMGRKYSSGEPGKE